MGAERDSLMRSAEKLVAKGKIEAAIREYKRVLASNPADTSILNLVGDLFGRVHHLDQAIDLYLKAATLFESDGFYVKSIAVYKKILRHDPSRLPVYEKLAELYQRQGLLKEARSQYQVLADHYTKLGDSEEAIRIYRQMVEMEPDDLGHRTKLAQLYRAEGELGLVLIEYRFIARFMLAHDRLDDAIKVLYHGLDLDSTNVGFVEDSVTLLKEAGRSVVAASFLEEAEKRNPEIIELRKMGAVLADRSVEEVTDDEAPISRLEASEDVAQPSEWQELESPHPELDRAHEAGERSSDLIAAPTEMLTDGPAATTPASVAQDEGASSAPSTPTDAEELLTEAQVFVKYGLLDKARERLDEVLRLLPDDLSARHQLIMVMVKQEKFEDVRDAALAMARLARSVSEDRLWEDTKAHLRKAGFSFDGDEIVVTPSGVVMPEVADSPPAAETPAALGPGSQVSEKGLPAGLESATSDSEMEALLTDQGALGRDMDGLSMLNAGDARPPVLEESTTAETKGFDLGDALGPGLREDRPEQYAKNDEDSIEEIVESFTKGVAETLSPEDYDTRYNLGIAYREMGLLAEAVGEFEIALESPEYHVKCCSMMAQCRRDQGLVDDAVDWYRKGLESELVTPQQQLAFRYEIGVCLEQLGERQLAYETFVEVHGLDSSYRDVSAKLSELAS